MKKKMKRMGRALFFATLSVFRIERSTVRMQILKSVPVDFFCYAY